MILLVKDGYRYCQDGRWRDFAMFGSYRSCVKEYRSLGHARRIAKDLGAKVVQIPDGMEIDASGKVIERRPCEDKPGWENVVHHKLDEFVVEAHNMNEQKKAVLLGIALLGATNAERSAYENVPNGKKAWDQLVAERLIIKDGVFFVLSPTGKQAVKDLVSKAK